MANIKPAEISAIIKNQLTGSKVGPSLDEVGTVLQVGDGIARIYGLNNVQAGEMVEFSDGSKGMALNLESEKPDLSNKISKIKSFLQSHLRN